MNLFNITDTHNFLNCYFDFKLGKLNTHEGLSNKFFANLIVFTNYNYYEYLDIINQDVKSKKIFDVNFNLLFHKLNDVDLFFFMELVRDYSGGLGDGFNPITHEINQLILSLDYNKRVRWGRIWLEKFYFDLFHKEKGFRWELLKYLQRDGETVVLPEVPGQVITSSKKEEPESQAKATKNHLSTLDHYYTIQEAIHPENPVIMSLFGGISTDAAATYVLDTLKNHFSSNQIMNTDFPQSKLSQLTQRGYYFNQDLSKLIRELEKIIEIKNKDLHKILNLPQKFPSPQVEGEFELTIQDVKDMLTDLLGRLKEYLQQNKGVHIQQTQT